MLVLIPQLHGVDDILPYHVGAGGDDTHGVEEMEHEPDSYDIVLLTERLTSVDTSLIAPHAAYRLADGEEDDTHHEREEEHERQHRARERRVEHRLHRQSHDDAQVEGPQIEWCIGQTLDEGRDLRKETLGQQTEDQWEDENLHHAVEHQEKGSHERDIRRALHHREEEGDDDDGEAVGYNHIDRHRGDASSELLRDHGSSGGCRTDDDDEDALPYNLRIGRGEVHDDEHDKR